MAERDFPQNGGTLSHLQDCIADWKLVEMRLPAMVRQRFNGDARQPELYRF